MQRALPPAPLLRAAAAAAGAWRTCSPALAAPFAQRALLVRRGSTASEHADGGSKSPGSPWIKFLAHYRKEHPEVKGAEVMQVAGGVWRGLSERERVPFVQEYVAAKQGQEAPLPKQDPERPKAPLTSFLRFAQEVRRKHPERSVTELATAAGAEWRQLGEEARKPYADAYAAEKEAYMRALERYVQSGKDAAWQQRVARAPPRKLGRSTARAAAAAGRAAAGLLKQDPERPKAPVTSFIRFVQDMRKKRPDMKATELATAAGADWRSLGEAEKKRYVDAYAAEREAYKLALQQYVQSGKEAAWREKVARASQPPRRRLMRPPAPQPGPPAAAAAPPPAAKQLG